MPGSSSDPTADADSPLFIVGAPRSGTTLVRSMLAASPDIAIPPESHFITYLYARYGRRRNGWNVDLTRQLAGDVATDAFFRTWGLDPAAAARAVVEREPSSFAETIAAFFLEYARQEGKTRWGDKTPNYVFMLPELARLFPGLRILHVVRDGRDVACSHLALARERGERWVAQSIPAAAAWWKASVRAGRAAQAALGERYFEVRYEDLVAQPEPALRRVCAFAAIAYVPSMLRYEQVVRMPGASPYGHAFERAQQGLQGAARDWRRELPAEDVADFEAVAGAELAEFGFPLVTTAPKTSLRPGPRMHAAAYMTRRRTSIRLRLLVHRHAAPVARFRRHRRLRAEGA